jgi:Uma2 family endonuclease
MTQQKPRPRIKFTVADYMTTPEDKRYQLLDGDMIVAPSPTIKHQAISLQLVVALHQFVREHDLGALHYAPSDVVLSNFDVFQPDILFISNERGNLITEANIQGAPDLVVEILSPSTEQYDRGYKQTLYGRHGVREYWIVDPAAETVEVLVESDEGLMPTATYGLTDTLVSPLLPGLAVDLGQIFRAR